MTNWKNNFFKNHASLLSMLIGLTLLCIVSQIIFFAIHYKVAALMDSFVASSLTKGMLHPAILVPLLFFIVIQIIGYILLVGWLWFIAVANGELFKLSRFAAYLLGILLFFTNWIAILTLNNYYFPDSFFAKLLRETTSLSNAANAMIAASTTALLCLLTLSAYLQFFWHKKYRPIGSVLLLIGMIFTGFAIYNHAALRFSAPQKTNAPNIILLGLDSLRPDFTGYFGNPTIRTPNIDHFLKTAATFTDAYTPLARTFPSWVSILTAKYPKNNHARTNLSDPKPVLANDTLAKRLQQAGYETIYATDEKRFSNITTEYGFDRVIGPAMGMNDFILGGLTDFPFTNLMINTSLGKILFPYNFANRAAAITYQPDTFLQLLTQGLAQRTNKPVFLAIHLCISHWPYTWAHDQRLTNATLAEKYRASVEAVDQQLGQVLAILAANGLLEKSVVVLLSDHGTTVGLPNDRLITEKNYRGNPQQMKWMTRYKLDNAKNDYTLSLNTSYGQGTDVLSLKQYHVLLAFKGFGMPIPAQKMVARSALFDIAPTILALFALPQMHNNDGIDLFHTNKIKNSRPFYLETEFTVAEIETNDIFIEKVIHQTIGIYQINPHTGQLFVNPAAAATIRNNKQRAVLQGDWLLAYYPASHREKLAPQKNSSVLTLQSYTLPPYFVLANVKTGEWTVGLHGVLANKAPVTRLLKLFNQFYGDEI